MNLNGVRIIDKRTQKSVTGGLFTTTKRRCDNSICSITPGKCCGFDSHGNYGCVVANSDMGTLNNNCR